MIDIHSIDWRLYAIIDRGVLGARHVGSIAESLLKGGAGVIQLRDKSKNIARFYDDALTVRQITRSYNIPFIVNDRADIALAVDADGVHLGQEDLKPMSVRKFFGKDKIYGVSVHSIDEFEKVADQSPTYYGVGAIFETTTKQDLQISGLQLIADLRPRINSPLIAIGGVTKENLSSVFKKGADGVAVASALLRGEDIETGTRQFIKAINLAGKK